MKLMIVFYIIFLIFLAAVIVVALTSSKILKNKKDAIIIYSIGTIIYGVLFILTLRLQLDSYNYVYVESASKAPINKKTDISNNDNTDNKKNVLKKKLEEILKEYKVKDITIVTLIEGGYEADIQIELDPQMPPNKENVKNKFNDIEGKVKPIINKYKIELVNNKSQLVMLGSDEGESHWEDIISENNIKDNPEDLKKHLYADSKGNGLIKGNTNKRTGEKIYHIPGSTYYNRTKIEDTEKWFKTIEEAEEAGYRAPKR